MFSDFHSFAEVFSISGWACNNKPLAAFPGFLLFPQISLYSSSLLDYIVPQSVSPITTQRLQSIKLTLDKCTILTIKQKYRPPDLILFHHPHSILYRILPFPECPSDLSITPWLWESDNSTARNSKESSAHLSDPVHLVPPLQSLCRPLQTQGPFLSYAPTTFCSHFSGPWTFLNIGDFCPFTKNPTSS